MLYGAKIPLLLVGLRLAFTVMGTTGDVVSAEAWTPPRHLVQAAAEAVEQGTRFPKLTARGAPLLTPLLTPALQESRQDEVPSDIQQRAPLRLYLNTRKPVIVTQTAPGGPWAFGAPSLPK